MCICARMYIFLLVFMCVYLHAYIHTHKHTDIHTHKIYIGDATRPRRPRQMRGRVDFVFLCLLFLALLRISGISEDIRIYAYSNAKMERRWQRSGLNIALRSVYIYIYMGPGPIYNSPGHVYVPRQTLWNAEGPLPCGLQRQGNTLEC